MRTRLMNYGGYAKVIFLILLIMFAMPIGCNKHVDLCCLDYKDVSYEHTYCNAHSRAVGHCLFDAQDESEAAVDEAIDCLESLIEECKSCQTVECVETRFMSDNCFESCWDDYTDEHLHADSMLVREGATLTEAEKASLIVCGFEHALVAFQEGM
jgi:hypothetical protein